MLAEDPAASETLACTDNLDDGRSEISRSPPRWDASLMGGRKSHKRTTCMYDLEKSDSFIVPEPYRQLWKPITP
jgi:hypothetical protein